MDFPSGRALANECFLLISRRSSIRRWSSTLDRVSAATHNLRDFRFSLRYLLPDSGTRVFSIYWDFLEECIPGGGRKIGNRKQFSQRRLQSQIELLPIFGIRFDWKRSIFSSRHQSWTCSIRSIFSWCNESSSRLKMRSSLCSDFLRINCSVTKSKRKHNLKYLSCFDAYFSPFRCFPERQQRKLKQTRLVAMV